MFPGISSHDYSLSVEENSVLQSHTWRLVCQITEKRSID